MRLIGSLGSRCLIVGGGRRGGGLGGGMGVVIEGSRCRMQVGRCTDTGGVRYGVLEVYRCRVFGGGLD